MWSLDKTDRDGQLNGGERRKEGIKYIASLLMLDEAWEGVSCISHMSSCGCMLTNFDRML